MQLIEQFKKNVIECLKFNPNETVKPACILWTDEKREWINVIPKLLPEVPELFVFGDYNKEHRTGPAIWLRLVLANKLLDYEIAENKTPIIYLPGISKNNLKPDDKCPDNLKPLIWLQFIGAFWSQANNKDWTILSFLSSNNGGLGLKIAQDKGTLEVLKLVMPELLNCDLGNLKKQNLIDKTFLYQLVISDINKVILQYLNGNLAYIDNSLEKQVFELYCTDIYKFNPYDCQPSAVALKLIDCQDVWNEVWLRYIDSIDNYPKIYDLLKQCSKPDNNIFWNMDLELNEPLITKTKQKGKSAQDVNLIEKFNRHPLWNEDRENKLRNELENLAEYSEVRACEIILELENKHSSRRSLPWSKSGYSPLALALEHLSYLAQNVKNIINNGSIKEIQIKYDEFGWKIDLAVLNALKYATNNNTKAIKTAVNRLYENWLTQTNLNFQKLTANDNYPFKNFNNLSKSNFNEIDCIIFVDGLRYDLAKLLSQKLINQYFTVTTNIVWAALPTVTATGKPAVSPIAYDLPEIINKRIQSTQIKTRTEKSESDSSQTITLDKSDSFEIIDSASFKKLMNKAGWAVINDVSLDNLESKIWLEFGDIDKAGHDKGIKLTTCLDLLDEICAKVKYFLDSGRKNVKIVTDHGWLLYPDELPKSYLPKVLVETKWSRVAKVKENSTTNENFYPWFWNHRVEYCLASGISCYKSGEEYAHGGISLQECLNLEILVTANTSNYSNFIKIKNIKWKGLRCEIILAVKNDNYKARIKSSDLIIKLESENAFNSNGSVSLIVEDEDYEGKNAIIEILNKENKIIYTMDTIIGEAY